MLGPEATDRAERLLEVSRPAEALELLRTHLASSPDDAQALCLASLCHLQLDQPQDARAAAEAAMALVPDEPWPYRLASSAAIELSDAPAAVAYARTAVRLDPEGWQSRCALSAAYGADRKIWPAHDEARWAVHLAPEEPAAHLQLSVAAEARMYFDEAEAAVEHALRLDPSYVDALTWKAAREVDSGKLARGARSVLGSLRTDPNDPLGRQAFAMLVQALLLRLYLTTLVGAIVVGLAYVSVTRTNTTSTYWPRASTGLMVVGAIVLVVGLTLRNLPPGVRREALRIPLAWRGRRLIAPVLWAVVSVATLAMAFLPLGAATAGGVALLVLIRVLQGVFLVGLTVIVVLGLIRLLRRLG